MKSTYQQWLEKFNAGGHESFEEFICHEVDALSQDFIELTNAISGIEIDEPPSGQSANLLAQDNPPVIPPQDTVPETPEAKATDDEVPPTDPNAGGSSNP